uniref:Uncharacterized protein n=1 Tax=Brassica oleracea TaxID=3712 RepID=A0A3P6FNX3_BRAOL|nr:unnamed protein product [Brassica oleracea]
MDSRPFRIVERSVSLWKMRKMRKMRWRKPWSTQNQKL